MNIRTLWEKTPEKERYDVFISYGSTDRKYTFEDGRTIDVIKTFKKFLEEHQHPNFPRRRFRVCTYEDDFDLDATVTEAICKKLQQSDVLLLFCSLSASESPYVAVELDYFKKVAHREVIPANFLQTPYESFPNLFEEDVLGVNLGPTLNRRDWLKQARIESHKLAARVWGLPKQQTYDRFIASERRRFHVRLRLFLLFFFIVSSTSTVAWNENYKRHMKSQVEERIVSAGGRFELSRNGDITVDYSSADDVPDNDLKLLRYLGRITAIDLTVKNGISDAGITYLRNLNNIESLALHAPSITGAGLKSISHMRRLRYLSFIGSNFLRHDLKVLLEFPNLQYLSLSSSNLNDLDMEYVGQCLKLESLNLWGTGIGNTAIYHLKNLVNLQVLSISYTSVTDSGFSNLASLQSLEDLDLVSTSVGDGAVDTLLKLRSLKKLRISNTNFSPQGVRRLVILPKLEFVALNDNQFSDEEDAQLRAFLKKNGIVVHYTDFE